MARNKSNGRGNSFGKKGEDQRRHPGGAGDPPRSYNKKEGRYEGYDEEKASFEPDYESGYEEDINEGYDQNYGGRIKKAPGRSNEWRAFDRGTGNKI